MITLLSILGVLFGLASTTRPQPPRKGKRR